jgi:hypothetical protein
VAGCCVCACRGNGRVIDCLGHCALSVDRATGGRDSLSLCRCRGATGTFRFFVADGGGKVDAQICFLHTDGVRILVWLDLENGDFVDLVDVAKGKDVADSQARVAAKDILKHGFGV